MSTCSISIPTFEPILERIIAHLENQRDTALVAAPGCGTTTLIQRIKDSLNDLSIVVSDFDLSSSKSVSEFIQELDSIPQPSDNRGNHVLIIDHSDSLFEEDFTKLMKSVCERAEKIFAACLWVGPLDARNIFDSYGVKIHSIPKSHITLPIPSREDMLCVYKSISDENECLWGEAIQFLFLDFCGNDFSLLKGATDYFYGKWTDKLYDSSIWDRMNAWLENDEVVNDYRNHLRMLPNLCKDYLTLILLGGKPPCPRAELHEEIDDALRSLCLQGFLVQNLLPGFYQLRNLTVKFLVQEVLMPLDNYGPQIIFRKATNGRISQLIQDVETMLRSMLIFVFQSKGKLEVQELLKGIQGANHFIPSKLNKDILEWADQLGGKQMRQSLNALINRHRIEFKNDNTLWTRTKRIIESDYDQEDDQNTPKYLQVIDYLTFNELGAIIIRLFDEIFTGITSDMGKMKITKDRWRENLSKITRIRNRVAHLRNVHFQDMEDLVGTIESMRKDLINFAGWR